MVFLAGWLSLIISIPVDISYDPEIAEIINDVSEDTLTSTISQLSGEEPVTIAGEPDSIPCRYAYSPGCYDAAMWLAEQMDSEGVSVELKPFVPMDFVDVDILPTGTGWATANTSQVGFVMPYTSHLFRTEDGGASWAAVSKHNSLVEWSVVVAFSDDSAFILANDKIMQTTDGESWHEAVSFGEDYSLVDFTTLDNNHGWAVGQVRTGTGESKNVLVFTSDGWETWNADSTIGGDSPFRKVVFTDTDHGWITSQREIWKTVDSGESWERENMEDIFYYVTDIEFTDNEHGLISGSTIEGKGRICTTSDEGETWHIAKDGLKYFPWEIDWVSTDSIWIVGDGGLVLFSEDAGQSWAERDLGTDAYLDAVDFFTPDKGVVAGRSEIRYIDDGLNARVPEGSDLDFMWNVTGTVEGDRSDEVIIIAHYDAYSDDLENYTPGADDNASGVSAVLEAARLLSNHEWRNTLKFGLMSGEEVGLWGAYHYAYQGRDGEVFGFVNADMIAYDGNSDRLIEVRRFDLFNPLSAEVSAAFTDVVDIYGLGLSPKNVTSSHVGDGWHLCISRMPGISIIEEDRTNEDFNPFYHTTEETLDKLNTGYLTEVTRACVGWMAHIADLEQLDIAEEIVIYAEPARLRLSSNVLHSQGWVEVLTPHCVVPTVYDVCGRGVKELERLSPSGQYQRVALDVSDLAAGVYWVAIPGSRKTISQRFVVVR